MAEALSIGDRIEFGFWEAGCVIWVAAKDFVSRDYDGFCNLLWDNDQEKLKEAILEQKAVLAMDLYQDDGYNVRVVMGELNEQEQDEWVARVRWRLDLSCGQMMVSGVLGDDEFDELPEARAIADSDDCLQCYVEVPPNEYQVEVYSYAPGDLSTGWGQIVKPDLFKPTAGIIAEPLKEYFERTRPNTAIPAWIGCEIEENPDLIQKYYQEAYALHYNDFVIRLSPILEDLPPPQLEESGSIKWEFRKPDRCPLGLIS
ncbi:hypothetical protein B9G53_24305 [Pseudanabaena sp. SR411]|uniref:hypothetical protein n=1 Tax=Pseudanabaena sp. SR411 TaxID=1980935 RepID=UPI000B9968B1|nr:hypothetical protein [Pseudanabaena sp. SR411]OYQ62035.1 hypothetical protein B9G53_24305 [Pseudanabaena sp. SR411]